MDYSTEVEHDAGASQTSQFQLPVKSYLRENNVILEYCTETTVITKLLAYLNLLIYIYIYVNMP